MQKRPRLFATPALICGILAVFFTVWIVLPPPLYYLWIVGIVGTEWSLWWGILGLLGAVLGIAALRQGAWRSGLIAIILGLFAASVSVIPLIQSLPVAQQNGVTLSASRYFFGDSAPREYKAPPPETVTFATVGGQTLKLDVYRVPRETGDAPVPALIVIHGGSWRAGHRSDFPHWDRWFVAHGYTVFDTDYRLAPQPNWKEASRDVKTAVAWVKRNAAHYGVDPDRLALLGRSAGAHLALLTAYTPDDPILAPSDGATTDTHVRAVISLYGPTDLVWGYSHPAVPDVIDGPGTLRRFLGGSPTDVPTAYAEAAPIDHIGPHTPPTLLFHGGRDLLVGPQHTEHLAARLAAAHVSYKAIYIPYAVHGFDFNINGWGSQIEQPILLDFLHTYLAPRKSGR